MRTLFIKISKKHLFLHKLVIFGKSSEIELFSSSFSLQNRIKNFEVAYTCLLAMFDRIVIASNKRQGSSRISVSATVLQLLKNVEAVVSRRWHCVRFDRLGNRTPDLRT